MISDIGILAWCIIFAFIGFILAIYGIVTVAKREQNSGVIAVVGGILVTIILFGFSFGFGPVILWRALNQGYTEPRLRTIFIVWALILVFAFISLFSINKVGKRKKGGMRC